MLSHFSRVQLFETPWTVACQAPLSMGFSRQEYWSGLPFPSPGDLPNPGIKPQSPVWQADSLPSEPPEKPPPVMRKPLQHLFHPVSLINRFGTWQRLDFSIILIHTCPESLVFHPSQTRILYFYQFSYSFFFLDVNTSSLMLMINWASLV